MVKDNKFNQYGYNHYLKAPARSGNASSGHSVGSSITRKFQTPLIAAVSLGIVVVLFVGIVIATYPSSDDDQRNIPIIKADLRPIKSDPVRSGGMSVANSESTIMANSGVSNIDGEAKAIENLLVRFSEEKILLVNKEDALNKAMEQSPMLISAPIISAPIISAPIISAQTDLVEGTLYDELALKVDLKDKEPKSNDILQKIGSSAQENNNETDSEFNQKVASAAMSAKPIMPKIYAAATAPDTLDFVRKILDEKASKISSIEPAIGAASPAVNITTSLYFVQLASITDSTRAGGEWAKMQAKYNVLSDKKFRVQEASLSGGKFYRIQAGPMSKSEAKQLCDSLKAENKAGGCLVVK